mmetsp:Transcript_13009/g.18950  ORF Transcript_13009/g.18950 Transcript_13009/m.18950 type:complete len:128 (-) Transcript_13009:221-604(-)
MFHIQQLILASTCVALMICLAQAKSNSFDNVVTSYGDFERCTFDICRNVRERKNPSDKKHPSSVHAFKKARGGHRKPKIMQQKFRTLNDDAHAPASAPETTTVSRRCDLSQTLQCGSRDHPYGWGMF